MSKVDILVHNYEKLIRIPWRDLAAAQRVIFAVYNASDERRLISKVTEFEIVTRNYGHGWYEYNLTNTFEIWMSNQKYAEKYFEKPHLISNLIHTYLDFLESNFSEYIKNEKITENDVVAITSVGSIFGFIKVRELVDRLAPLCRGRLLVFFPGSYENNNYRLLDGYDGWNYHALPITCDKRIWED